MTQLFSDVPALRSTTNSTCLDARPSDLPKRNLPNRYSMCRVAAGYRTFLDSESEPDLLQAGGRGPLALWDETTPDDPIYVSRPLL